MKQKSSLKTNLLYSSIYQILTIVLPLITAPYVARVLGANASGIYSKSQALANYFFLFAMLGVNNYGNRTIARVRDDKDELNKKFSEIYTLQIITGVVSCALYIVTCYFINPEYRIIYLLQTAYVFSGVIDVNWCCFGLEKFKLTTIRSMLVRVITAVCVFVFIKSPDDLWLYTIILSCSYVLSCGVVWLYIRRNLEYVIPSLTGVMAHIKPNLVLFWPVIAVSLYNIMDKIILGHFSTNEEVAFYTNAERIVTIPTTLILALDNVVMPRMSNIFAKNNTEQAHKLMSYVMLFAMFMSAAMSFGLAGVSDVFAPWFYGKEFIRCGYFILLLSPTILFKGWAGALRTQFIIPTGRDKIYIISLTIGAIINLILDFALIPSMNGVGAIIGTLAAEFSVVFIQFALCRKDIPLREYMKNGISFLLIGLLMFFCVESIGKIGLSALQTLLLQVLIGVAVYVMLASIYMIITKQTVLINEGLKILRIKKRL